MKSVTHTQATNHCSMNRRSLEKLKVEMCKAVPLAKVHFAGSTAIHRLDAMALWCLVTTTLALHAVLFAAQHFDNGMFSRV